MKIESPTETNLREPGLAGGKRLLAVAVLVAGLMAAGCSRSQDQVAFEREAFRQPSGFTETRADGEIVSRDERDWQIGPMFQGYVEVFTPAFPNPTRGERVRLELDISGLGVVEGLVAIGFYDMFDARTRRVLNDEYAWNRLDPGLYVIDINPAEFDRTNSYSSARQTNNGLHRLFIYDNRNNLITYGDIKLE